MKRIPIIVLLALVASGMAYAEDDLTSLSYVSYLERYATVKTGQGEETLDVVANMPLLAGDRLDSSRGARVEVQLADGSTVWLDEFSTLDFDALAFSREDAAPRTVLYLAQGSVAIEIPATALGEETLRVDSADGQAFLGRPGLYRLDLVEGRLHVETHLGLAELPDGIGSVLVRAGQETWATAEGVTDRSPLRASADDFWLWVQGRRLPGGTGRSAQYVDSRVAGRATMLDSYGDWVWASGFSSWMWRPRVTLSWVPYSYGRWHWTPVGWSWISYEPWGWVPFHYGSWYWDFGFGWVWGYDSVWGPAWVHWLHFPGYVGWCPRGYYDGWYWQNWDHGHHGDHGIRPARWNDVTLRLDGRVRLRDVDPRPWTVVPSDDFGHARVDRVRVDPGRLLRDEPDDRFGTVRSGPMVTERGVRGAPGRSIESVFDERPARESVPDLSRVVGRDREGDSSDIGLPSVRTGRTGDVVVPDRAPVRSSVGRTPVPVSRDEGGGTRVRSGVGRAPVGGTAGVGEGGTPPSRTPSGTSERRIERPSIDRGIDRPPTGSSSSGEPRTRVVTPRASPPSSPPSTQRQADPPAAPPRTAPPPAPATSDPPTARNRLSLDSHTSGARTTTRSIVWTRTTVSSRVVTGADPQPYAAGSRAPVATGGGSARTIDSPQPLVRTVRSMPARTVASGRTVGSAAPSPRTSISRAPTTTWGGGSRAAVPSSPPARAVSSAPSRASASSPPPTSSTSMSRAPAASTRTGANSSPSSSPRHERH